MNSNDSNTYSAEGKYNLRAAKIAFIGILAVIIIGVSVGVTLAILTNSTPTVENVFTPGKIILDVTETFENNVKTNVKIKNNENIPAFIRAALVFQWVDANGNVVGVPVSSSDYSITLNTTDWIRGSDGFYYCKTPIQPGAETPVLVNRCEITNTTTGYNFALHILAQGVQTVPETTVSSVWPVTVSGGQITSVS